MSRKAKWITGLAVLLVLGLIVSVAVPAFAQGRARARLLQAAIGPAAVLRDLDLTDGQRVQIKTILHNHRAEIESLAQQMIAARIELRKAIMADKLDEALLRQKFQKVAQVGEEATLFRAKIKQEIAPILTPWQKALIEKRFEWWAERLPKMVGPLLDLVESTL